MQNKQTALKSLGEIAIAAIPVVGYYSGHTSGVKEGYVKASDAYEKKCRVLKERMQQIKRDVLGDNELFIYPAGWDEEYWLKILSDFISSYNGKEVNAKDILLGFIDLCLEKFPQDKLAETCHQLKSIRNVLTASPTSRITIEASELELTIHFLDVFGRPTEWNSDSSNESMKILAMGLMQIRDEIKSAMCNCKGCNFLILGKTGTGKSSLLNYLLGQRCFEAGVGKPVTKRGIWPHSTMLDNFKVTVYDSWGLESGDHFEDWHEMLNEEKQRHDLRQNVTEWFHSIVYCIQASGARIEDVDVDIINSFLEEKYHLIVVLTKADLCSEEDEDVLRNTLLQECPMLKKNAIIGVCSEEKKLRDGVHHAFGRDELKTEVLNGYIGTIINQLPKRCVYLGVQELNKYCSEVECMISSRSQWDSDNEGWLKGICQSFAEKFNSQIFPKIIHDEIMECATISQALASLIDYKDPYFSDNDLFSDFDEWYMKTLKVIGAIVFAPIAIIAGLFAGTKWEREKLKNALESFKSQMTKNIEEQEPIVREKLRKAIKC